jgi:hypothetical protein
VIAPAAPTITTAASGAVDLGRAISDTAILSGGANPTGQVEFKVYGPDNATCTGTPVDTSARDLSPDGIDNSAPFRPTIAGTYRWVAKYLGDANNSPVTTHGNDTAESVVVSKPVVQPALITTASTTTAPAGSSIHDTATLSGGSSPTGAISFAVYGPDDSTCANAPDADSSAQVTDNGDYMSAPFTPSEVGTYHWVAMYSGDDSNHAAGPTACADSAETVVITQAHPSLRTQASAGVVLGGEVNDTAFVDGSRPRGTIICRLFGPNDGTCSGPPAFTTQETVTGSGTYPSARRRSRRPPG